MPPPVVPPRQDLLERIDRCLDQFKAKKVNTIEDNYDYVPNQARARMGAGSYGETFRMKSKEFPKEPARIVKCINKARIAVNNLQVQHLCVELAVLKLVKHENLNQSTDLLHSPTTIFIVLELCEGDTPSIETRLYHLLAKFHPARMTQVPLLLKNLLEEIVECGIEGNAEAISEKEEELIRRECDGLCKKEIPISSDLFNCIVANTRIHPTKAAIIAKGVLQGLNHLHEKNIVHRDMKTENIVLGETRSCKPILDEATGEVVGVKFTEKLDVKVIDFGLVKYMNVSQFPTTPSPGCFGMADDPFARAASDVFDNTPSSAGSHLIHPTPGIVDVTPCGTEIYCALEVLDGIVGTGFGRRKWQTTKDQLPKFDVYGAGTALYCMINGRPPFRLGPNARMQTREARLEEIQRQVKCGPAYWSSTCPPEMKELVLSLMKNEVRARPTTREALKNPLIANVGDTFSYEVMVDGTLRNVCAPMGQTSLAARSVPIPATTTAAAAVAATAPVSDNNDSGSRESTTGASAGSPDNRPRGEGDDAEDSTAAISDLELEKREIDEIMAVIRGNEDDGDAGGKASPATDGV